MKLIGILCIFVSLGCGVKGDPKPPVTPAALGHGQPSFKRATKALAPTQVPDSDQPPRIKTIDDSERE